MSETTPIARNHYKERIERSAARRAKHGLTKVANRPDLLPGVDMRSLPGRRFREVAASIVAQLGGAERITPVQLHLARRFAAQTVMAEQFEAALVAGQPVDPLTHCAMASAMCRLSNRIGLHYVAKELPSLATYLASRDPEPADDADDS